MRCVGEINAPGRVGLNAPATLLPLVLGDVRNFPEPGAGEQRSRAGQRPSEKGRDVLTRLPALPDGSRSQQR